MCLNKHKQWSTTHVPILFCLAIAYLITYKDQWIELNQIRVKLLQHNLCLTESVWINISNDLQHMFPSHLYMYCLSHSLLNELDWNKQNKIKTLSTQSLFNWICLNKHKQWSTTPVPLIICIDFAYVITY